MYTILLLPRNSFSRDAARVCKRIFLAVCASFVFDWYFFYSTIPENPSALPETIRSPYVYSYIASLLETALFLCLYTQYSPGVIRCDHVWRMVFVPREYGAPDNIINFWLGEFVVHLNVGGGDGRGDGANTLSSEWDFHVHSTFNIFPNRCNFSCALCGLEANGSWFLGGTLISTQFILRNNYRHI